MAVENGLINTKNAKAKRKCRKVGTMISILCDLSENLCALRG